jgi:hypothetical protein
MGGFLVPSKIIPKGFGARRKVSHVRQVHARDTAKKLAEEFGFDASSVDLPPN